MQLATKAVHAGVVPDPSTGAIMTPIFQTSTYVQTTPGNHKGYEYGRTQNPTRDALQKSIAALENAQFGLCFASGMSATDAIIHLLTPGDEVIVSSDLYGGTYRLFMRIYAKYGIKFHFHPMQDLEDLQTLFTEQTRLVWIETPSNPMLNIINLAKVVQIAQQNGKALLAVDNTFASPCLQNPLDLGAHLVVHSATKYIGGHSDVVMGAILCNDPNLHEQLKFLQNAIGAVPSPMDCFLTLRGIKTIHLRLQRQCENALRIAEHLSKHPAVAKVNYPGLKDHPQHELASTQMRGYGGMISFSLLNDTLEAAHRVLSATRLFALAESLGGVESLIGHPASMTHASIPLEERMKTGVVDSLLRLSVGVEDVNDLIRDLDNALAHSNHV